jgi:hypothetical protein
MANPFYRQALEERKETLLDFSAALAFLAVSLSLDM